MTQQPIELILLRQWATYLDIPIWLMDGHGDLLFYNEPAEAVLGIRFDEAGRINAEELSAMFITTRVDGSAMPTEELPVVMALRNGRPAHGALRIRALNNVWRTINVTAFPVDASGRRLGVVALFWEQDPS